MLVLNSKIENNKQTFEIQCDQNLWKKAQNETRNLLKKKATAPGFRPGHVPENLLNTLVTQEEVLGKAYVNVVNSEAKLFFQTEGFKQAIGNLFEDTLTWDILKLEPGELVFTATYDTVPDVQLIDYKNLKITKTPIEVTDQEVENDLNKYLKKHTFMNIKDENSTIENGDNANIDFTGKKNGVEFQGGKGTDYDLVIGSHSFIPGFEEQLIGLKAGESKTIDVTFPENYQAADLAGQPVQFDIVVNSISSLQKPVIDKAFINEQLHLADIDNEADLKAYIKKQIFEMKDNYNVQQNQREIIEQLSNGCKLSYVPEKLLLEEIARVKEELKNTGKEHKISEEQIWAELGVSTQAQFDSFVSEKAILNLNASFALRKIITELNLTVSQEEAEEFLSKISRLYGINVSEITAYPGFDIETIKARVLDIKVFKEIAKLNNGNNASEVKQNDIPEVSK